MNKNLVRNVVYAFAASMILLYSCDQRETPASADKNGQIDRFALVTRHNVEVTTPDTLSSLTVGNGEFAFTVDVSGLQSFPQYYENGVSLGTLSQWGWHVIPSDEDYKLEEVYRYDTAASGQVIPFPVQHSKGRKGEATTWLRTNPHRLHLGLVGLELTKENGEKVAIQDLQHINQKLNLWTGAIESTYEIEGVPVKVELYGDQEKDGISARGNFATHCPGKAENFLQVSLWLRLSRLSGV